MAEEEPESPVKKEKLLGRESKLLTMLKNIDGKIIHSAEN